MDLQDVIRSAAASRPPGQFRLVCPSCSSTRKLEHRTIQTLSIKVEGSTAIYHCHHCSIDGRVRLSEGDQRFGFNPKAASVIRGPFSERATRFLKERKIDPKVAETYGVQVETRYIRNVGETSCLCFPYRHEDVTYAWKFRAVVEKGFSCEGSPTTFFGLDQAGPGDLIITEGELDVLALATVGVKNALSVPSGAPLKVSEGKIDPREDGKFRFVWHAANLLKDAKKIIIATDGDGPGQALGEELARRIGRARCWKVSWPEGTKDANDVLLRLGATKLLECVAGAHPWPVVGLYGADHYRDKVVELFVSGTPTGVSTGYRDLDQLYRVIPGQLTVVTGTPSHGKSQFIDNLMVNIATECGWRFAVCSFENPPQYHIPKLLTLAAGEPFFENPSGNRMTRPQLDRWYEWVSEHFDFVEQADGTSATIDSVLERAAAAVQRNGVRGLVIDPYNYLERPDDDNETRYVSNMLSKVRNFATLHDVHVWFVAHPSKLLRVNGVHPIPKGWDISGSMAWFSKADNGLTVYRPEEGGSEIHVWKIRWSWAGRHGIAKLDYDHLLGKFSNDQW